MADGKSKLGHVIVGTPGLAKPAGPWCAVFGIFRGGRVEMVEVSDTAGINFVHSPGERSRGPAIDEPGTLITEDLVIPHSRA